MLDELHNLISNHESTRFANKKDKREKLLLELAELIIISSETKDLVNNLSISLKILNGIFAKKQPIMDGSKGNERTFHEKIFALMYPELEKQKTFGTGKKGVTKYNAKNFTVDFYDKKKNIAIEIDGKSHGKTLKAKISDLNKQMCLLERYKIRTIRITNDEVESMIINRLENNFKKNGVDLNEYRYDN